MELRQINYVYFSSKINEENQQYVILESQIGFDDDNFRLRVIEIMSFIGLSDLQLADDCYLDVSRVSQLIGGTAKFEQYEINVISKRLGF
jgi:hypothetical protein